MTSQLIRRFQLKGTTTDSKLEKNRATWHRSIINMMRDDGFVPVIDIDPVLHLKFVSDDKYEFSYTWHGVYIGKDAAWRTEGILNGKQIPFTQKHR